MGDSIWKKEISFGRKPKQVEAEPAAAPVEDDAPPPKADGVPFWKKEVSLSRKPKAPKEPKAKKEPKPKDDPPFWKKEVSFSRKPKPEAAPEQDLVATDAAEPSSPPEPEEVLPDIAERIAPWVAAAAQAAAERGDAAAAEAAPNPAAEDTWTQAPELPQEPAPVAEAPAAAPVPVPVPEPVPVPAATPRVEVHPPVPAAELPPLAEKKTPFWKLELKRKAKEPKEPKPAKEPKAEKPPKEKGKKLELKRSKAPKVKSQKGLKERGGGSVPKKLVGLKIGGSQLAAARVQNNGHAELVQLAREPLEQGIVVGGELRDPEALAETLKEFFKRHKLPKKGVRLGIANNRIGVRTFEITGIDDPKQLANAIRFRAQEALPIPIEEAVLDYHILSEKQDDEGQMVRRVLLVVAYRELVDRYVDACKKAGVQLSGIDLEAFALLRALAAPQDGAGGDAGAALVAVAIGHDRSTFAVSDGRTCEFTRVLEWGGGALNVAIARELNAAPSEVEGLKRMLSLADDVVPEGVAPEQATAAREAVRKQVQAFARELVSSLQFYQSQPGSLGIGEIVLTGGTAHLHGIAEELQRLIGVRVRVGDPLARVKVPKKFDEPEQLGSMSIAIGLGIDD